MKYPFFILLTALTLASCSAEKRKPSSNNNNVFQVDEDFCQRMQLPPVAFSIEYPKTLKAEPATPGQGNFNYNAFKKMNAEGIQTEGISFGSYKASPSKGIIGEGMKRIFLGQVLESYSEFFAITDFDVKNFFFGGKRYLMLRAKGKGLGKPEPEFKGDYLIQSVLMVPEEDGLNGLVITFIANEKSPYKTFGDFADKGDISKVWRSLKFE